MLLLMLTVLRQRHHRKTRKSRTKGKEKYYLLNFFQSFWKASNLSSSSPPPFQSFFSAMQHFHDFYLINMCWGKGPLHPIKWPWPDYNAFKDYGIKTQKMRGERIIKEKENKGSIFINSKRSNHKCLTHYYCYFYYILIFSKRVLRKRNL